MEEELKPVRWIGSSYRDLKSLPVAVRKPFQNRSNYFFLDFLLLFLVGQHASGRGPALHDLINPILSITLATKHLIFFNIFPLIF
jgi:hypothetical protein